MDRSQAGAEGPMPNKYERDVYLFLSLYRFFAYGLAVVLMQVVPGEGAVLAPGTFWLLTAMGLYTLLKVVAPLPWRRPGPVTNLLLASDLLVCIAALMLTGGLTSGFLLYSLMPVLTAALLLDERRALVAAAATSAPVLLAHTAVHHWNAGFAWIMEGNLLLWMVLYVIAAFLVATAVFRTNLNIRQLIQTSAVAGERKRSQEERLKLMGLMASGIAHDFGVLLTPIRGHVELLQGKAARGYPEFEADLQALATASRDAVAMVERLRELYKPTGDDTPLQAVDLNEVVQETVEITRPIWEHQPRERGLSVSLQTALAPVPLISADPPDLREILINLLSNSLDAMPEGGTVTIETEQRDGRVRLQLRDTGVGMPEEVRQRCMDPFFSTKGSLGTGLGLAMVATLVARNKGVMNIESAPGAGTTVLLDFPTRKPPLRG